MSILRAFSGVRVKKSAESTEYRDVARGRLYSQTGADSGFPMRGESATGDATFWRQIPRGAIYLLGERRDHFSWRRGSIEGGGGECPLAVRPLDLPMNGSL